MTKIHTKSKSFKKRFKLGGMGTLKIHHNTVESSDSIHTELQLLYPSAAITNREVIFIYTYYLPCQGNDDNIVNDCATSMAEFFKNKDPEPLVVVGYIEVWEKTNARAAKEMLNWAKITVIRQ